MPAGIAGDHGAPTVVTALNLNPLAVAFRRHGFRLKSGRRKEENRADI
ncbi:MAG TPA: hypothetical protein PLI53_04625 [Geobacteraceae bacterium]|nr:hypothetical protein [Geobacteraceae bacterium]